MPSTKADTPQLAIPFRMTADGREAVVEQGTAEDFVQHAKVAARIERGHLDADPNFGTTDQTFRQNGIDPTRLESELRECDPRPGFDVDQVMQDAAAIVTVRVSGGSQ